MGEYRYTLTRELPTGPNRQVCWVMLNPSTATEVRDDLTISKVKGFTERLGARFIVVVNLFALRATQPRDLLTHPDPVGRLNYFAVKRALAESEEVVFAWGSWWETLNVHKRPHRMDVEAMAAEAGHKPLCLGTTAGGSPRHPSRLGYETLFVPYKEKP